MAKPRRRKKQPLHSRGLTVQLTSAQSAELQARADEAGILRAEYIREAIFLQEVRERPSLFDIQAVTELTTIGNALIGIRDRQSAGGRPEEIAPILDRLKALLSRII